jgi:cobalt-zinc-cadmium efflux system membrane fusion protein
MQVKIYAKIALSLFAPSAIFLASCHPSYQDDHDAYQNGNIHSKSQISNETNQEQLRGPHGGRLLHDSAFSIELKIFETGVHPQFRLYGFSSGEAISPKDFTAEVTLKRLGGITQSFSFFPTNDFLACEKEVNEPHSFDVTVKANYKGVDYLWQFASYEGRTSISDEVAKLSGVKIAQAKSKIIRKIYRVQGKIVPSEHRIAHVIPRFSGVVRKSMKHIGDKVEKGEILALIESNQSLQPFEVRSQISGTIINGHVLAGEFVPENEWIYIVADLSEVWADFYVPLREKFTIKSGDPIIVNSLNGDRPVKGTISYIAPYADEKSQNQLVRVVIPNTQNLFPPGMFVVGDLIISELKAEVAVKNSAIQTFRDWQVVFVKYKDLYEIKPLKLGQTDGNWTEVVSGLALGEDYVSENAFLIKADILKSGASHDH